MPCETPNDPKPKPLAKKKKGGVGLIQSKVVVGLCELKNTPIKKDCKPTTKNKPEPKKRKKDTLRHVV